MNCLDSKIFRKKSFFKPTRQLSWPSCKCRVTQKLRDLSKKIKNNIAESGYFLEFLYQTFYKYRSPRACLLEVGLALTQDVYYGEFLQSQPWVKATPI